MNARTTAVRAALDDLAQYQNDLTQLTAASIVDGLLWDVPTGERYAAWTAIVTSQRQLAHFLRTASTHEIHPSHAPYALLVHQYQAALDHAAGLICLAVTR